jgi:hypothetical protein
LYIVMTTIDNDESSDSMSNSNLRQTNDQSDNCWLPLTNEQVCFILSLIIFI